MRIKRLEIGAFGKFRNYTLELEDGFSLFYGENEEGKSTVMEFVRMMFYGSSVRGGDAATNPRKKYLPWDGAKMEGAIVLEWKGRQLRLQRSFGASNAGDRVSLVDAVTGETIPCGNEPGEMFFGMGASAFERSLFIGQLGSFSSSGDKEGEMNRLLTNLVSSGDETASYTLVEKRLQEASNALFSKRGVGSGDKLQAAVEALEKEWQQARDLEETQRNLEKEILSCREEQAALGKTYETFQKSLKWKDKQKTLEEWKQKREQVLRLEKEEKAGEAARRFLQGRNGALADGDFFQKAQSAEKNWEVAEAVYEQAVREEAAAWEGLQSIKPQQESSVSPKGSSLQEAEEQGERLSQALEKARQEKILKNNAVRWGSLLLEKGKAEMEEFSCHQRLERLSQQKESKQKEVELFQGKWEALEREKEDRERCLEDIRISCEKKEETRAALEKERKEAAEKDWESRKKKAAVWSLFGLLLVVSGGIAGWAVHPALWALAALGVFSVGIAVMTVKRRKTFSEEEEQKLHRDIIELKGTTETFRQDLTELRRRLSETEEALKEKKEEMEPLQQQEETLNRNLYTIEARKAAAEISLGQLQQELSQEEKKLGEENDLDVLRLLQQQKQQEWEMLQEQLTGLLQQQGCSSMEELRRLCRESEAKNRETEASQREYKKATEARGRAAEALESAKEAFLRQIRPFAPSPETLEEGEARKIFASLEDARRRKEETESVCEAIRQSAGRELPSLADVEAAMEKLQQEMEMPHENVWAEDPEKLRREGEQLLEQQRKLGEAAAAKEQALQHLFDGRKTVSQLEREIQEKKELLEESKARWAALQMTQETMSQAFRELQSGYGPMLNQGAAEILSALTGGKYTGMLVDRSFGLSVLENGGSLSREWKYLSSGTVDQAYFALRLAISRLLASPGEGEAPIFLDDVFAQYDENRTRRGLAFLQQYAREQNCQIFLFTCHKHILRMAEEEKSGRICRLLKEKSLV